MSNWLGLRCWLRWCPCRLWDDGYGVGGQCVLCWRVVGYVTNDELRAMGNKPQSGGGA